MQYKCKKPIRLNVVGPKGVESRICKEGEMLVFKTPIEFRPFSERMAKLCERGYFQLVSREYEMDYRKKRQQSVLDAEQRQQQEIEYRSRRDKIAQEFKEENSKSKEAEVSEPEEVKSEDVPKPKRKRKKSS